MKINIIVAMDSNRGIAKDGKMPWKNKHEMEFFKSKTMNKVVLMGNKTAKSLPKGKLDNRMNLILTRKKTFESWDAYKFYFEDISLALSSASIYNRGWDLENEIWVIGGLEIYKELLPIADKIYISEIHGDFGCDKTFPFINTNVWKLMSKYSPHESFTVYEYER